MEKQVVKLKETCSSSRDREISLKDSLPLIPHLGGRDSWVSEVEISLVYREFQDSQGSIEKQKQINTKRQGENVFTLDAPLCKYRAGPLSNENIFWYTLNIY